MCTGKRNFEGHAIASMCTGKRNFEGHAIAYMCSSLEARGDQTAVARAFRNFMKHVIDYDGQRIPDAAYETPP
jgi:hypothetical protein